MNRSSSHEPVKPRQRFLLSREFAIGLRLNRHVDHLTNVLAGLVIEVGQDMAALNQRRLRLLFDSLRDGHLTNAESAFGQPRRQRRAAGVVGFN